MSNDNIPPAESSSSDGAPQPVAVAVQVTEIQAFAARVAQEVSVCVVGMKDEVHHALAAILAGGHVLLEGPPGVAKTFLVRTLAAALGGSYQRIQFTPDLMPSDVTGTSIFRPGEGEFIFQAGPIFAQFLLCDEINRAPAKTQAALLEAMQEHSATVDGVSHALPEPFLVFATQNPLEHEGTYPLPEAQLDRFLFKVLVDYPTEELETQLLQDVHSRPPAANPTELGVKPVLSPGQLLSFMEEVAKVSVREDLPAYVVRLLRATRDSAQLILGGSPRAGVMLLRAAKAIAAMDGRDYVLPDDLKLIFLPAMRHRVVLDPAEEIEGGTTDQVLRGIMDRVEVPR
jgi:MoxR-like ATPase